jgi:acetate---CoA ligase (ADP-forming)
MGLDALLRPSSVAILGASERPSIGRAIMDGLTTLGFPGQVFPINPKYQTLLDRPCFPSVAELPQAPDVVAFCVGASHALDGIKQCASRGAGAAVIYDAGFAEQGERGRALQAEIADVCREAGIALCGPNGMGVLNVHDRSSTYMLEVHDARNLGGNVGFISQSGSICVAMMSDVRRFGFSYVVSSGNEAVTSATDYFERLIEDPKTKVIAAFLESVREPERFVAALDRAAGAGKPVVVLKVGQSERSRKTVSSHTGGLAGEARVFSEVLRAHRAMEVRDLDELTEVLAALQGSRLPEGPRIGVVTSSGGKSELILDIAIENGIPLPPLDAGAMDRAVHAIGSVSGDGNPLDAWGNGNFSNNFPMALKLFDESPDHDAVVLTADGADNNPMGRPDRTLRYAKVLIDRAAEGTKPHYLMGMRPGIVEQPVIDLLMQHDIPAIGGTRQGFGAIQKIGNARRRLSPYLPALPARAAGASFGAGRATINEFDAKRLLKTFGLPVARELQVRSGEEAQDAANEIGFPVVLKFASDQIPHKTELGLVAVGLMSVEALDGAWARMNEAIRNVGSDSRADGVFIIQEMVTGGIEVMTGISRDPQFGLVMAFGLGGVAVELMNDVVLRLLPLREGDAAEMLSQIRLAALLRGARASKPYDIAALTECLERFGQFAWAEREAIEEIDLNPILVLPEGHGCRIVDALIVPRPQGRP